MHCPHKLDGRLKPLNVIRPRQVHEGPLGHVLVHLYPALQHQLRVCRSQGVHVLALGEFQPTPEEGVGNIELAGPEGRR